MITILHGDNLVASRLKLSSLKTEAQDQGKEVVTLDGKGIDRTALIQSLESHSLFSVPKLVVIERLIGSLKTGAKLKDELIEYLLKGLFDADIVLWENKSVGKSLLKLKKQKHVFVEDFKLPVVIFKFTESLTPKTIHEALFYFNESLKSSPVEVVFTMLVRQFRLLLAFSTQATLDETEKMIPWIKGKYVRQAGLFTKNKLQDLYKELLVIDYQTKTGKTPFDLTTNVQRFIMNLGSV
jgi:hypothetical protein